MAASVTEVEVEVNEERDHTRSAVASYCNRGRRWLLADISR